jgi:hypothetical protein
MTPIWGYSGNTASLLTNTMRFPLLAQSGHANLANGRPILARTSGLDVWTCTPKREALPKRGDAERIYLRTFRLPADSLPLSETIS